MPIAGQNMRDCTRQPSICGSSVNTKWPEAPSCADSVERRVKSGFIAFSCCGPRTPMSSRLPAPPTMRISQRGSRSLLERARASSTARRSRSASSRPSGGALCRTAMRRAAPSPRTSTSTRPAFWRCRSRRGAPGSRDSTKCVATVACPTKPDSVRGVKKRTRRSWSAPSAGSTKAVSPLLSSRAMASISSSDSDSAPSTTPAGLPVNRRSVNASTWKTWMLRDMAAASPRGGPAGPRKGRDCRQFARRLHPPIASP